MHHSSTSDDSGEHRKIEHEVEFKRMLDDLVRLRSATLRERYSPEHYELVEKAASLAFKLEDQELQSISDQCSVPIRMKQVLEDEYLLASIQKHIDAIEKTTNYGVVLSVPLVLAALQGQSVLRWLSGFEQKVSSLSWVVIPTFSVLLVVIIVRLAKVRQSMQLTSKESVAKAFSLLCSHSWWLNPFAWSGDVEDSTLQGALGWIGLYVSYGLIYSAVCFTAFPSDEAVPGYMMLQLLPIVWFGVAIQRSVLRIKIVTVEQMLLSGKRIPMYLPWTQANHKSSLWIGFVFGAIVWLVLQLLRY